MMARPQPVEMVQFRHDGTPSVPVRDDGGDRAGALLDELDDLIATLDAALAARNAARAAAGEAERTIRVAKERIALTNAALAAAQRSRSWGSDFPGRRWARDAVGDEAKAHRWLRYVTPSWGG